MKRFTNITRLLLAVSLPAVLSTSCNLTPAEERLEDKLKVVEAEYKAELKKQINGAKAVPITLTWNQALEKLFYSNPEVLRANYRIDDSREAMRAIWRTMIPSLNISISESATLEDLGALFEDTSLRVSSFVSLGNLLNLPKRLIENRVRQISVELLSEQVMRNQVIALYRLFQEQHLHDLEQQAIVYQKQLVDAEHEDTKSIDYVLAAKNIAELNEDLELKRLQWNRQVNEMFMGKYTRVRLVYSSLPKIKYSPSELDFQNAKRWGRLQLNLLAIEAIADEARFKQLFSRYYPTGYLNVSAPPLFQSNANRSFRFEDIRISPSMNWALDTRDSIGRGIDRYRREKPIRDWDRAKRRSDEVAKLLEGKLALRKVQQEFANVSEEIVEYQDLVKSGVVYNIDIRESAKHIINLREKQEALRAKEIDISTSFWLLDESRWSSITKRWKKVRLKQEEQRRKQRGKIPFLRPKNPN